VEVPGPATDALCRAAREHGVHLVVGINELDGGTIYNSLLFVSDEGSILGVHRKLVPTHAERIVWGRGDGSGLRTHRVGPLRVGSLNCWENWMPLARHALYADGVADLDPARIAAARHSLDPAGHYARPDVFAVTVDRRRQQAATFTD
jgi:predicted amidohydrolase